MLIFGVKRLLWGLDIFLFSYLWIYFPPATIYVMCYTQFSTTVFTMLRHITALQNIRKIKTTKFA